jgi:hypothetical protein
LHHVKYMFNSRRLILLQGMKPRKCHSRLQYKVRQVTNNSCKVNATFGPILITWLRWSLSDPFSYLGCGLVSKQTAGYTRKLRDCSSQLRFYNMVAPGLVLGKWSNVYEQSQNGIKITVWLHTNKFFFGCSLVNGRRIILDPGFITMSRANFWERVLHYPK